MADHKDDVNASLDGGEGGDALGEDGGGKKKLIIIVVILLLVVAGAGAGLYFSGLLDKFLKKGETTEEGAKEGEHGAEAAKEGEKTCTKGEDGKEVCTTAGAQFLKIPDMIVNLNSEDGTPRYLRLSVQLEFKNAADMAAVEKVLPRVVDQFQTYLRELRVRDLRGSAGIYRLQMELLARVNQAAYPVEVQDVLFQEILIQ
jgi:flagellar FliL protein